MFSIDRVTQSESFIEYRTESLTGIRTRICPQRLLRGIGTPDVLHYTSEGCPFCPDMIESVTPTFPNGARIHVGESITFPNLYPFAAYHIVTAITREHRVLALTPSQIIDALLGQVQALVNHEGYASINWNYLPSAGASLPHPHLQGLCDMVPDTLPSRYLDGCQKYVQITGRRYADDLVKFETDHRRNLVGLRLFWYVNPVPIGEREIRCILPLVTVSEFIDVIEDFSHDIVQILSMYRDLGTSAFNMSIFFGMERDRNAFSAFCSVISRINPNPLSTSDTAFMERLHLEPVILTLPEDLAEYWRDMNEITGVLKKG